MIPIVISILETVVLVAACSSLIVTLGNTGADGASTRVDFVFCGNVYSRS